MSFSTLKYLPVWRTSSLAYFVWSYGDFADDPLLSDILQVTEPLADILASP